VGEALVVETGLISNRDMTVHRLNNLPVFGIIMPDSSTASKDAGNHDEDGGNDRN
jgi:hypothetical protein